MGQVSKQVEGAIKWVKDEDKGMRSFLVDNDNGTEEGIHIALVIYLKVLHQLLHLPELLL